MSSSKAPKPPKSPKAALNSSAAAAAAAESSQKRKAKDLEDEEDALAILNAVVQFRATHDGVVPTPTTMKPVHDAVKDSLHRSVTIDQLYNKFRTLRSKYQKSLKNGPASTPFERAFVELSAKAWLDRKHKEDPRGSKNSKRKKTDGDEVDEGKGKKKVKAEKNRGKKVMDAEEESGDNDADAGDSSLEHFTAQVTEMWQKKGMSMEMLKLGLEHMDKAKAKELEKRWIECIDKDLELQAELCHVDGDLFGLLAEC